MKLASYLNRPEYIFRPLQIRHRLLLPFRKNIKNFEIVSLPWGTKIRIHPHPSNTTSYALWIQGVYDLSLTEVIWRLIDAGEVALDIGANIGYTTNLIAKRVGKAGKVWCFEPNPEIYRELFENIKNWQDADNWYQIEAQEIALSNESGTGLLGITTENVGEGSLVSAVSSSELSGRNTLKSYKVVQARLDEILEEDVQIDLIKIDIEGHELQALQGAENWVTKQHIRDIVFEEHNAYPSALTQFLESHGYTVFRILKGFWKPLLQPPAKRVSHPWEPPNYLATIAPQRALNRMKPRGWNVFSKTTA